jgi:hypothetical protein
VTVTRTGDYHGELTISEGNQVLHRESVGRSYGATFGPDVADVADWRRIAVEFVDGQKTSPICRRINRICVQRDPGPEQGSASKVTRHVSVVSLTLLVLRENYLARKRGASAISCAMLRWVWSQVIAAVEPSARQLQFGGPPFSLLEVSSVDSSNFFRRSFDDSYGVPRILRSIREYLNAASWRMEHLFVL